jgi:O-succinylhomoserine sulfhydrylase
METTSGDGFEPQRPLAPDTLAVRGGLMRSGFDETSEALYLTSGFVYASAEEAEAAFKDEIEKFIYSRYGNPTVAMFEERMRGLEGAEACFATASGMSAVFVALAALCGAGSRLVASRALFGSCFVIVDEILPRWGVETVLVDGADLSQWEAALDRETAAVFFETPSNPMQELVDIRAVSDLAHAVGAQVVVDNVFGTPVFSKPLQHGADIVVYSTTKHIDGGGRVLGGAVLGPTDFIQGPVKNLMRHTGPAMSPFNAWVNVKGLETLRLRVE